VTQAQLSSQRIASLGGRKTDRRESTSGRFNQLLQPLVAGFTET
jgi:hypothetical protein